MEIVVLRAIAKQVAIDSWCWCHDREVYRPQPRIDNDILVPIADKLSEYAENQPWDEVNDLSEDVRTVILESLKIPSETQNPPVVTITTVQW